MVENVCVYVCMGGGWISLGGLSGVTYKLSGLYDDWLQMVLQKL